MKRIFVCLIALGLALSVVGCGGSASTGDDNGDDGAGTLSISGTIGQVRLSGSNVEYMGGTADTIDDVIITAYSDSSYTNDVTSDTIDCSTNWGTMPYTLTGFSGGATYYLKAKQRVVYDPGTGTNITTYHFGTAEAIVASSNAVDVYVVLDNRGTNP